MISAGDIRNGITFELDGKVMQVIEFQHVKPGKGAAFVRVKMRNVITGGVTETSLNPSAKFPTAYIERKKMEYSYSAGSCTTSWIPRPTSWCPLRLPSWMTPSSS